MAPETLEDALPAARGARKLLQVGLRGRGRLRMCSRPARAASRLILRHHATSRSPKTKGASPFAVLGAIPQRRVRYETRRLARSMTTSLKKTPSI
jgi:hypothetical protein